MYIDDTINMPVNIFIQGEVVSIVLSCKPTVKDILAFDSASNDNILDYMYIMFQHNTYNGRKIMREEFDTIQDKNKFVEGFLEEIKKKAMNATLYFQELKEKSLII